MQKDESWSQPEKYCRLICRERKTLFVRWKNMTHKTIEHSCCWRIVFFYFSLTKKFKIRNEFWKTLENALYRTERPLTQRESKRKKRKYIASKKKNKGKKKKKVCISIGPVAETSGDRGKRGVIRGRNESARKEKEGNLRHLCWFHFHEIHFLEKKNKIQRGNCAIFYSFLAPAAVHYQN